jgi:hypothetical protein
MKQKLIITVTAAAILVVTGSFLSVKHFSEKPVTKNINVEIFKTASYVSPAYSDTYATLHVSIVKVHGKKRETAWQHDFEPKQLKDYPASDRPLVQTITIPNVNDKKEKLEVLYEVTYSTKGSELNLLNGTIIGKGVQNGKLNIKI